MSDYNHSRYGLNPLPGEEQLATQNRAAPGVATLPPLDDDHEPWTPISPSAAPPVQHTQAKAGQAFCQFCGSRVAPDAVLCLSCGRQIKNLDSAPNQSVPETKPVSPGLFAVAVILTLLFPVAGIFFGISGLTRKGQQGHGAAIIVLSFIMFCLYWIGLTNLHH